MPVTRRLAFVFPGFEPMPVEAHCARFIREARRNAPVYGMELAVAEPQFARDGLSVATLDVDASGEGWRAATRVVLYGLGDLNDVYAERGPVIRMAGGLWALGDFLLTGTFFRFVRTSWRYGLFFLYPIVLFLAALALALSAAHFLPGDREFRLVAAALVFAGLLWLASAKMHFLLMMDDWSCARDIARGSRPEITERIAAVAADMRARMAASDAEEVVLAAHSFGAITAVLALASVLRPDGGTPAPGLLTAGSSLLKVALHPAAGTLRAAVERIARGAVVWIDAQSLTDPMNFFRSDPVRALGIAAGRSPRVMQVRFRRQLSPETYRAIKRDLFRVHRQFVYAVEKRSFYSFHAILCGPEAFAEIAARGGLAESWPAAEALAGGASA